MLSIARRLKKGDRESHEWSSEGIVKKSIIKKKRTDGKTISVQLVRRINGSTILIKLYGFFRVP